MTEVEISREATDRSGTTEFPPAGASPGYNLARKNPDENDNLKVAYHDHSGEDGHADKAHIHHYQDGSPFPAFVLAVKEGSPEYRLDGNRNKISRVVFTTGKEFNMLNGYHRRWSPQNLPTLYMVSDDPNTGHHNTVTIREKHTDDAREITVDFPIAIQQAKAFLYLEPVGHRPGIMGHLIDVPLPAIEPAEGASESESED